ncbi:MAG: hypothetical protein WCG45_01920 [bacterium]
MHSVLRKKQKEEVWWWMGIDRSYFHRKRGPAVKKESQEEYWAFGNKFHFREIHSGSLLLKFFYPPPNTINKYTFIEIDGTSMLDSFFGQPTVTYGDGTQEWYRQDNLTKRVYPNGTIEHYSKDCLHNYPHPAIEYANGDKEWWYFGTRHRDILPAVIHGKKKYWYTAGIFLQYSNE